MGEDAIHEHSANDTPSRGVAIYRIVTCRYTESLPADTPSRFVAVRGTLIRLPTGE